MAIFRFAIESIQNTKLVHPGYSTKLRQGIVVKISEYRNDPVQPSKYKAKLILIKGYQIKLVILHIVTNKNGKLFIAKTTFVLQSHYILGHEAEKQNKNGIMPLNMT
ncbi:UNKNOWN [Stylonychia lemnae]|uniref:Uncharacterized protein n=1 Tax=Stylonychia lemnae TaxID=5949 RepID=A0A078ARI8_STYLE|nr:UNKNOWN [Stylonychia lemnae]|eukprot:CDW84596.1 UNKNOWN [Stylonychia lemnae]